MAKKMRQKTLERVEFLKKHFTNENGEVIVDLDKLAELYECDLTKARWKLLSLKKSGHVDLEKVKKKTFKVIFKEGGQEECNYTTVDENKQVVAAKEEVETNFEIISTKNSNIEIFVFRGALGNLTVFEMDGEIWFLASDVANALGYAKTSNMLRNLEKDEARKVSLRKSKKNAKLTTLINESGLYSAILSSNKPEAKKFKKWVTSEVLPSIRKHGAYLTPTKVEEVLLNPDTIIKLAQELKKEREEKLKLSRYIEEHKPHIEFSKAVEVSEGAVQIADWVKAISKKHNVVIGRNKAFQWLKNNGYLRKNRQPYQKYIDNGYFEWKPRVYVDGEGKTREGFTTYITGKGQIMLTPVIVEYFKGNK